MINQVILIGRITHPIKVEETTAGIAYSKNAIAVVRKHGGNQTDFINIITWRNQATFFAKFVKTGDKICVRGRLESSTYTSNGSKQTYVQVNVDQIEMLGSSPNIDKTQDFKAKENAPDEVNSEKDNDKEVPWELDL